MGNGNDGGEAAAEFYEKRQRWAEYVCTHAGVSDRAFRVGWWLSRRMNGDDQCCWYSVKRIAHEIGRKSRYVQYAIRELEAAELAPFPHIVARRSILRNQHRVLCHGRDHCPAAQHGPRSVTAKSSCTKIVVRL